MGSKLAANQRRKGGIALSSTVITQGSVKLAKTDLQTSTPDVAPYALLKPPTGWKKVTRHADEVKIMFLYPDRHCSTALQAWTSEGFCPHKHPCHSCSCGIMLGLLEQLLSCHHDEAGNRAIKLTNTLMHVIDNQYKIQGLENPANGSGSSN